jgi:predicted CopG family antitoxin
MSEENLDLNVGEEETPLGDGQPESQDSSSVEPESQDDGDTIQLSREVYDKLLTEKENYKKGLLSAKEKIKSTPKESKSEFLPKQDFYKANEKEAISKFIADNPEIKEQWSDFVQHYSGKRGRDTVNSIVQDLDDAKTLFQKHNPAKDTEDKSAQADLSKESAEPRAQGQGGAKQEKKSLFPKRVPVTEWYKTE